MKKSLKQSGIIKTYFIIAYSIYLTLRISIIYIAYTFYLKGIPLREKGNHLLHWWSERLLSAIRLTFTINSDISTQLPPNRACIIMSNHSSAYDIPLILLAGKKTTIRMIAKQELFRTPIWGRALRLSEFIPLNRQNKREAIKQLQYAKKKLEDGIVLWVSPEGTRSADGELLPFKNGGLKLAKQMDAVIIPVCIKYPSPIYDAKKKRFNLNMTCELLVSTSIDTRDHKEIDCLRDAVYSAIAKAEAPLAELPA